MILSQKQSSLIKELESISSKLNAERCREGEALDHNEGSEYYYSQLCEMENENYLLLISIQELINYKAFSREKEVSELIEKDVVIQIINSNEVLNIAV